MDKNIRKLNPPSRAISRLFPALVALLSIASGNAVADSASCVSPNSNAISRDISPSPVLGNQDIEWRVSFTVDSAPWYTVRINDLQKSIGGGRWENAKDDTWQIKWGARDIYSETGTFSSTIEKRPVFGFLGPRLVSPDGACVVYLGYPNIGAFATVAVVGDSLVHNTYYQYDLFDGTSVQKTPEEYEALNRQYPLGMLGQEFAAQGWTAAIEAIPGRRLNITNGARTAAPDTSRLGQADTSMLDEFRGMSRFWLVNRARVVALGANDAFYIAGTAYTWPEAGSTPATRLNDVTNRTIKFLAEATRTNTCVVLIAPPRSSLNADYNSAAGNIMLIYALATLGAYDSQGIDHGRLRFADFGAHAQNQPTWFQQDKLHLNDIGAAAYAKFIKNAVLTCP